MKNVYLAFVGLSNRQDDYLTSVEQTTVSLDDNAAIKDAFMLPVVQRYMKEIELSWPTIEVEQNGVVVWDAADNIVIASDNVYLLFERIANVFKDGWTDSGLPSKS